MEIVQAIKSKIAANTVIPKPAAKADFTFKAWGIRRGEEAFIYYIPNHKNPDKPYQKGITVSEWRQAYEHISKGETFTREWFNHHMPNCAQEGGCNFTTIGGVFELLGLVDYTRNGYKPHHNS